MIPPKSNVLNVFKLKKLTNDELMLCNDSPKVTLGVSFECKKLAEFYIRMFRDQDRFWSLYFMLLIMLVRVITYIVLVWIYMADN